MDPILVNSSGQCKWDEETTLEDAENEKLRAMEEAAWYNDEFGEHMVDSSKKEKNVHANMKALDELHCNHSHNMIHQKKGNQTVASEEETFQDGSRMKPVVVESGDEEETITKTCLQQSLLLYLRSIRSPQRGQWVHDPVWNDPVPGAVQRERSQAVALLVCLQAALALRV